MVTGGASGIGRAIAERCVAEGMRVMIADIEAPALKEAAEAMKALPYQVDVSDAAQVEAMCEAAYKEFGAVHLLFNNAGVAPNGKPTWAQTLDTWKWMIDVNLYGVIHGIRSFVPRMLAGGEEGHVVSYSVGGWRGRGPDDLALFLRTKTCRGAGFPESHASGTGDVQDARPCVGAVSGVRKNEVYGERAESTGRRWYGG